MGRILKVSEDELETIVNRQVSDLLMRRKKFDPASLQWFSPEQEVDFKNALNNKLIWDRSGWGIYFTYFDGEPDKTWVRFNRIEGAKYRVNVGWIQGPFNKVYLTADQQISPTKKVRFIVSYRRFAQFQILGTRPEDKKPGSPGVLTKTMTQANYEYLQVLPEFCQRFLLHTRDESEFRLAFTPGHVATPTEAYFTVPANSAYCESDLRLEKIYGVKVTFYLASPVAGKVAELITWK